jgi:hypothetical protein
MKVILIGLTVLFIDLVCVHFTTGFFRYVPHRPDPLRFKIIETGSTSHISKLALPKSMITSRLVID